MTTTQSETGEGTAGEILLVGGYSGSIAFVGAPPDGPISEVYSVFSRPPTERDEAAVTAAQGWFTSGPDDEIGNILPSDARRLVDDLDRHGEFLYAVPTDRGRICFGIHPDGGGSCGEVGPDGFTLSYDVDEARRVFVYGLAGDTVKSVEVVIDGTPRQSRLHDNGYVLQTEVDVGAELEAVRLRKRDGTVETFPLLGGPTPGPRVGPAHP